MPDFQFSDADSPPEKPQPAPPAPPNDTTQSPPEKSSEFQISAAAPAAPTAPRKAVAPIPGPPIPNLQVPTPKAATPQTPVAVPRPAVALSGDAPSNPVTPVAASENNSSRQSPPQDNFSRKIWDFGQKIRGVLNALETPASWILRIACVAGITTLAYILAATLFGGAGQTANPQMAELTKNLDLASKAFVISLLAAAVASLVLGYEDNRLGIVVGLVGLLCYFGIPIALKQFVGDTRATSVIAANFRNGGYFLLMIGLVKGVADTAIWLWNLPDRMKTRHANVGVSNQAEAKQRIIAREANMFSPCWKLPFCRESIRKQCPAFLAKKTCWKFGRGCYCDTEMISRIVRGESLDVIKAPTQQSRQGKPPCGRCYIYLEHQTYKFRMLSPLVLPVTVLATWFIWPFYSQVFNAGNRVFESLWSSLSFNSAKLTSGSLKSSQEAIDAASKIGNRPEDIAYIVQNMFGVLLGFMLLIYLSKFIEWAIYKAKW